MAQQLPLITPLGASVALLAAPMAQAATAASNSATEPGMMFYGAIVVGLVVLGVVIAWLFQRLRAQSAPHHHAVNPHDVSEWSGLPQAPTPESQTPAALARRSGQDRRGPSRPQNGGAPRGQDDAARPPVQTLHDTVGFGADDAADIPIPRFEAADSMPMPPPPPGRHA